MRNTWLIFGILILALMIGVPGCKQSQEEPKTTMEEKAAAPEMDQAKEAVATAVEKAEEATEAVAPAVEKAEEAAEEANIMEEKAEEAAEKANVMEDESLKAAEKAKTEGSALVDTMKEKAAGEADKAMEDVKPATE